MSSGRILKSIVLLFLIFSFFVTSCGKKDFYETQLTGERYLVSYGEVIGDQSAFDVKTDEGKYLYVVENKVPKFSVYNGQHVIVNYTLLSPRGTGFEVRVNALDDLITDKPLNSTDVSDGSMGSAGGEGKLTPIEVKDIWVGGKYLNVNFNMLVKNPELAHSIRLIVDDQLSTQKELVLMLVHTSLETADQRYVIAGHVSFDISQLIPEGQDEIPLKVKWVDYKVGDSMRSLLYQRAK